MASVAKPIMHHGRRLFELLEEQQEPFLLDVYLLEHGYSHRATGANAAAAAAAFMCWPRSACRKLRRFGTYGFFKRKRGGILRFLLDKVVVIRRKAWRWDGAVVGSGRRRRSIFGTLFEMKGKTGVVEFHRLSCSGGTEADREDQCRAPSSSTQRSPVSVLELQHSDEVEEEVSSISAHRWAAVEELLHGRCHDPQRANPKKHFYEPHHFVLDRLREVEGRLSAPLECSRPEKRGKNRDEEVVLSSSYDNHGAALANISPLIDCDLSESGKEWRHHQHEMTEVGTQIEHLIFEEIREETLVGILVCQCTLQRC
ncbi:hypothetical protein OPV22_004402 [Ensete ventricosum]|uniref:NAC domain-containing protein n=1 Tax=Ensete ventricosum TaxID=4639 RepID=A0AAV8S3N7_ENSVE|nr:hypothetical protein OPV22_004402 [Ensete ventricosum]